MCFEIQYSHIIIWVYLPRNSSSVHEHPENDEDERSHEEDARENQWKCKSNFRTHSGFFFSPVN